MPDMLTTPFTADQIRDHLHLGLVIDWESFEGEVTTYPRWTVLATNTTQATFRFATRDASGVEVGSATERAIEFEALRRHALFPSSLTTREVVQVASDVGEGEGWLYTLNGLTSDGMPSTTHYTFLSSLPGPPVHMIERHGDAVVTQLTQRARK